MLPITIGALGAIIFSTASETFPVIDKHFSCARSTEVFFTLPQGDVFYISGVMNKLRPCRPKTISGFAKSMDNPIAPARILEVVIKESYRKDGAMVPRPEGLQNFGPWEIDAPPWENSIIQIYVNSETPFGNETTELFAEFRYNRGAPDG